MTLLVATQDPNAPAETYVRQHMRLIAPDHTVAVAMAGTGAPPLEIPFHKVSRPSSPPLRKAQTALGLAQHGFAGAPMGAARASLKAFMRAQNVSVVLAEFGPTGAALRSLCKEMGIPLVVNFHGYDATVMPKSWMVRHAYRLLARDAAAIIGGSEHFCQRLVALGFPSERITVVPCGIETQRFGRSDHRTGRRLLALGRLTAKKAPHLTVQAVARARETVPDLTLDIIGDGPMRATCEAEIARLGLENIVTLHGAQDHDRVRAMLSEADIFLQHSVIAPNGDTESQGISLIEAMASYLPVVATDHNGFSETVVEAETGFLVPEGDVAAMADRIVNLLQNADMRSAMGQAGRKRAETVFDAGPVTQRMRHVLAGFATPWDTAESARAPRKTTGIMV